MIKLHDFITSLGYGTLKNLHQSIVDPNTHVILDKAIPEIVHWINEGLVNIFTTYDIQDSISVHIHESRTLYPLRSEHNMTLKEYLQKQPPYERFIWKSLEEEYNDNLMQIRKVVAHEGVELPLNDPSNEWSAFTREFDVLELPVNMLSGMVEVIYRAKHPVVSYEDNTNISLPPGLYDALANFVAFKIHSGMNTELSVQNAQKYYQEYKSIMDNVYTNGTIETDYQPDFTKFYKRGFI